MNQAKNLGRSLSIKGFASSGVVVVVGGEVKYS